MKKEQKLIHIFRDIDEHWLNLKNQYPKEYKKQMKYLNDVICGRRKLK